MTTLYTILAIIGAVCVLCCGGMICALCVASSIPEPKPIPGLEQTIWSRHAAKIASRRAS